MPLAAKLRICCQTGLRSRLASVGATSSRVAAKRKATVPAEPATVKPYERHVFVQLPRPADAPEGGPWWPSVIESNPALLGMFSRVAAKTTETAGASGGSHESLLIRKPAVSCTYTFECRRHHEDHSDRGSEAGPGASLATRRHCNSVCLPRRSAGSGRSPATLRRTSTQAAPHERGRP